MTVTTSPARTARRTAGTGRAGTREESVRACLAPWLAAACVFAASAVSAQTIEVHSEFRRINTGNEIVAADRGGTPREILSPAVPRNGYASFHLTITAPHQTWLTLYIGQNPENAVRVALYREVYAQRGGEWVPDSLEPIELPFRGAIPDDCKSLSFWMDIWVPAHSPSRRVKVEPQLNFDSRWIIYPMEVRIKPVRIPPMGQAQGTTARIDDPADAAVRPWLRRYLCAVEPAVPAGPLTVRRLIARNARQDMVLASSLEPRLGRGLIVSRMLNVLGAKDRASWCAAPTWPAAGPEWYLRVRDFLFRAEDP